MCDYLKDFHHHITTNINTINEKKFPNFSIQIIQYEGSKIIRIFLELIILYNNTQKFNIPISILITRKFPYESPIFYIILKSNNTIYNQQNHDIDLNTGKLLVKSLINWDYSLMLYDVLIEVYNSFNKVFPILQAPPGYNKHLHINNNANYNNQQAQPNNNQNYNNQVQNFNVNNQINQENYTRSSDRNCKYYTTLFF